MKKLIGTMSLALILLSSTPAIPSVFADTNPSVAIDGKHISFDQPPVIIDGRTLVPLRMIFNMLGAAISWNSDSLTVTAVKNDKVIKLQIGNNTATINDQNSTLDVPPQLVNDHTMVPLRFVSEAFGAKVNFDESSNTITISSNASTSASGLQGVQYNDDQKKQVQKTMLTKLNGVDLQTLENDHIRFHYTKDTVDDYKYLYDQSGDILNAISTALGFSLDHKVDVYIYSMTNDPQNPLSNMWKYPAYYSAGDFILINSDYLKNVGASKDIFKAVLAEKLTYANINQKWGLQALTKASQGAWLVNGYAYYIADKYVLNNSRMNKDNIAGYLNGQGLNYGDMMLLPHLDTFVKDEKLEMGRGSLVESMIFFMEDKYGNDTVMKLLNDLSSGKTLDDSVMDCFSKSQQDVLKEWRQYFNLK